MGENTLSVDDHRLDNLKRRLKCESPFFYLFEIISEINEPLNFDETTNKGRVFERTNQNLGFKMTKVKTRRGRIIHVWYA